MTVVLSYFPSSENLAGPQNGIELLSDHIYSELMRIFPNEEVIYVNFQDGERINELKGPISYFFGISNNFNKWIRKLKPETSCLISVNEHALFRRTIRDLAKEKKLPRSSRDPHDGYVSDLFETTYADFVLGIGSWSVLQSYLLRGYPAERVFVTGYPYWQHFKLPDIREQNRKILMFPGYICTRKGADLIEPLVRFLHNQHPEFILKVVGFTAYSDWKPRIRDIARRYPKNLEYLDIRIKFGSEDWLSLNKDTAFAIFPSREEGLAGCALDIMNLGIPLVHSSKTGIEFQHPSLSRVDFEGGNWEEGLSQIINSGSDLWSEIASCQRKSSFHLSPSYSGIAHGLERIAKGRIWPNIDLSSLEFVPVGLKFLSDPSKPYDYIWNGCQQTNHIELSYRGETLKLLDALLMSVMVLEKYSNFDSLALGLSSDQTVVLSRTQLLHKLESKKISLEIDEYFPVGFSQLPSRNQINYLHFRELFFTLVDTSIYRINRYFNIVLQKIRLEVSKIVNSLRRQND